MNRNDIILSICVPTYNRCKLLGTTIESIIFSLEQSNSNAVEIIISDNASTDNTPSAIDEIIFKYPFIKRRTNKLNVVDENFFLVANEAIGKFIWIFGDDDLMLPQAVTRVLLEINNGFTLLMLNYSMWDVKLEKMVQASKYKYTVDETITNPNTVLSKYGTQLQFITAVVIKKEIFFSKRNYDYNLLHQYGNSFLYAVYAGIYNNCHAKFIVQPLLKYRGGNSTEVGEVDKWYNFFIYGNNFFLKLLKQQGYNETSIRKARYEIIKKYLLPDIIFRKKDGYNAFLLLKKIPFIYYTHPLFLFIGPLLICIPNKIIKTLFEWYKKKRFENLNFL